MFVIALDMIKSISVLHGLSSGRYLCQPSPPHRVNTNNMSTRPTTHMDTAINNIIIHLYIMHVCVDCKQPRGSAAALKVHIAHKLRVCVMIAEFRIYQEEADGF